MSGKVTSTEGYPGVVNLSKEERLSFSRVAIAVMVTWQHWLGRVHLITAIDIKKSFTLWRHHEEANNQELLFRPHLQ
jgi:hypothetical protein